MYLLEKAAVFGVGVVIILIGFTITIVSVFLSPLNIIGMHFYSIESFTLGLLMLNGGCGFFGSLLMFIAHYKANQEK